MITWLNDDINKISEKIVFRDRIEYRYQGKLHFVGGYAYISDKVKEYYLFGNKLSEYEYTMEMRYYKLNKLLKK